MPLVRRGQETSQAEKPPVRQLDEILSGLASTEPEARRRAARDLAVHPGAVAPLAEALAIEEDTTAREAILTALIGIRSGEVVQALLPFLRSDDAALRNGTAEVLATMPDLVAPHLPGLLDDLDPDVRILATELARTQPAGIACDLLCRMLERETQANACGAALDVLAELGTPEAIPAIRRVAARFAGEPFLRFAAEVAVARIQGGGS